mmetsp:Transcript_31806/g.44371  ORF Transcript_31806/g.44371 Transcript_31806/m.44371 type:complete len:130 (+) Transcript_31806:408-797(+)
MDLRKPALEAVRPLAECVSTDWLGLRSIREMPVEDLKMSLSATLPVSWVSLTVGISPTIRIVFDTPLRMLCSEPIETEFCMLLTESRTMRKEENDSMGAVSVLKLGACFTPSAKASPFWKSLSKWRGTF